MENLAGLIHSILASQPDNHLIYEEELDCQLLQCDRADAETDEIAEALREIDDAEGLVVAFLETDDLNTFGVALRSKVKRLPLGVFIAKGFEPYREEGRP